MRKDVTRTQISVSQDTNKTFKSMNRGRGRSWWWMQEMPGRTGQQDTTYYKIGAQI